MVEIPTFIEEMQQLKIEPEEILELRLGTPVLHLCPQIRNRRSLHYAPPDFLLNLVALMHFMRLSLTERRKRCLVQCRVAGNPGTLRSR
jgi:hypothetical protein